MMASVIRQREECRLVLGIGLRTLDPLPKIR